MTDLQDLPTVGPTDDVRALARKRLEKRRNLIGGFVAYVVFNVFFVAVWFFTGRGYFWPAWIIAPWGVGMVMGVWDYLWRPITEADVDEEVKKLHR